MAEVGIRDNVVARAPGWTAAGTEVERTMRSIFKRCVECGPVTPTCPACPSGDICSLVPQTCDECAHMVCIANPSPAPPAAKTNVGAIAGGVVGGVAFMAFLLFLFWRYWAKKRRAQQDQWEIEDEDDLATQKGQSQFNAMKSDAASTKTSRSVAASFLSRASNIIHIAYIPGVTNRFGSGHNSMTAPVPPIPAAYANRTPQTTTPRSPLSHEGDALFFRPSDLRDSTWSDGSSLRSGKRDTQYTTHSITPSLARSSLMSDIYRDDATTEPMPATQVFRALPRMVSVKSFSASATSTPSMETPPTLGPSPGGSGGSGVKAVMLGEQPSITSSPSSHHTGGTFAKATPVTIGGGGGKGKGRIPVVTQQTSNASSLSPPGSSISRPPASTRSSPLVETANESDDAKEEDEEEDERSRARKSLIRESTAAAASPAPLIQPLESPFFDATELRTPASSTIIPRPNPYAAMSASVGSGPRTKRFNSNTGVDHRGPGGLSAVIEEAAKRASQDPDLDGSSEGGDGTVKRDPSPFADNHAYTASK